MMLTEILHSHSNHRLIGVWESKGEIDLDLDQRMSLNGVTLRASTVSVSVSLINERVTEIGERESWV